MVPEAIRKKIFFVILILTIMMVETSYCQEDEPEFIKIQSELELIQWDLQDECSEMGRKVKSFWLNEPTGLRDKIRIETDHANFLRTHAYRLKVYEDVPYDMQRNWTYFTKCGDALLTNDEYKALNVFANKNLELKLTDRIEIIANGSTPLTSKNVSLSTNLEGGGVVRKNFNEQDVLDALATCRNASQLKDIWMKWQSGTRPFKEWYGDALKLTNKAAIANDCVNVESYWELLTDIPSGYELSRNLYENITPFYEKLMNFVRLRLNNYYNTTFEDNIPTYLTGSFMAEDWSNLADIILPNPQLYHDLKVELEAREIYDFYKYAGNATKNLGFGDLTNSDFFKRSKFDATSCDVKVLDYCSEQYSSILTCNHSTLNDYFNAHDAVMRLGLTKVNIQSHVRQSLRYSPVIEGLTSMSSLLSINGMVQHNILEKNVFLDDAKREENRMTILLLLALRIFSKIAYYHAMDEFRLDLLENHGNPEEIFQEYRQKIQRIFMDSTDDTAEYLRDEHILYNRPYLSKMLGQFLQFQLISYYQIDIFEETDISTLFNKDTTFRDFILNIPNRETEDLLSYYYNIDEISDYPLLSFFSPLEEYLDDAPLEQSSFIIKKAKYVKPIPTKTKTKPKAGANDNLQMNNARTGGNNIRKIDILTTSDVTPNNLEGQKVNIDKNGLNSGNSEIPVKTAKTQIGIYIGAAIVLFTLGIIGGGFLMQRRRTQRNNRRYNA